MYGGGQRADIRIIRARAPGAPKGVAMPNAGACPRRKPSVVTVSAPATPGFCPTGPRGGGPAPRPRSRRRSASGICLVVWSLFPLRARTFITKTSPCIPAAETALCPPIRCSESLRSSFCRHRRTSRGLDPASEVHK